MINRNTRTPNEIVIKEDHAEIVLYNFYGEETARALISLEDVELVKEYKWNKGGISGVNARRNSKLITLHRLIMGFPVGMDVDHINHNRLDNRRINLRSCTHQHNTMNMALSKRNKSGVKGVSWDKNRQKWRARVQEYGKEKMIGRFDHKKDAIKARVKAEIKNYKQFADVSQIRRALAHDCA